MCMNNSLKELVCEAVQEDDCIAHCNHSHCYKVNNVYFDMTADKVYYSKESAEG